MVLTLIGVDVADTSKRILPKGVHKLGRNYFEVEDKRVSRSHCQISVNVDSIELIALHINPCFYIKKDTQEIKILKQLDSVHLSCGDKFGLLPNSHWYELILSLDDLNNGETEHNGNHVEASNSDENETIHITEIEDNRSSQQSDSPSLLPPEENAADDTTTQSYDTPSPQTVKRCHSPVPEDKDGGTPSKVRVKDEPNDGEDVKPGTSGVNNQMGSDSVKKDPDTDAGSTNSPVQPSVPPRERCIYGSRCYRKNPAHKAEFSHPADSDWGTGECGVCPFGASCGRRDPRHWTSHEHPPGTLPPTPHQDGQRRKKTKPRISSQDDTEDLSPVIDNLPAKRTRKTIQRQDWSDSEHESEVDPYATDESDEWEPSTEDMIQSSQTQDF